MTVRTSEYTQNQNPDTVRERIAVASVKALIYLAIRTPPYEMCEVEEELKSNASKHQSQESLFYAIVKCVSLSF